MKKPIELKETRTARPVRLAAWAVAVATALAGAAGIAAARGNAAPLLEAGKASHARAANFTHARLDHGLLAVRGSDANDKLALRLEAGEPGVLEVDVGD